MRGGGGDVEIRNKIELKGSCAHQNRDQNCTMGDASVRGGGGDVEIRNKIELKGSCAHQNRDQKTRIGLILRQSCTERRLSVEGGGLNELARE